MTAETSPPTPSCIVQTGIVRIPHEIVDVTREPVAPGRLVRGAPLQAAMNHYSDAGLAFHCGVWEGDPGAWRVRYTEHEFCHMLAGRVRIVDDRGGEQIVEAGDSFVIPAGFSGVWDVLEPARKLYVVYEPPGGDV